MPRNEYNNIEKSKNTTDQTISQITLARIRRPSTATTSHSQCTMIRSEESDSSRAQSYTYSPSLLNPPMVVPGLYPPQGIAGSSGYTPDHNRHYYRHQGTGETPTETLFWPSVTLPPIPSTDDASSMVEGLLHPRLGMALAHSQQASSTSLRDHEDYSRPINGVCFFFWALPFFSCVITRFLYSLSRIIFKVQLLLIPWI